MIAQLYGLNNNLICIFIIIIIIFSIDSFAVNITTVIFSE